MSSSLIINSPYSRPTHHWIQKRDGGLELIADRRPAGYEIFDTRNNTHRTESLVLVNSIRERVDQWRADQYPGVTSVTKSLLEHWHDRSARQLPFYYCQLEAIETLIWWTESPDSYKQGISLPNDGGEWRRICSKMATGTGKTTVMAMIISWQVLNAISYPKRNKDFSKAIFIVAPGLTVKERLQVLLPGHLNNYYDDFNLCPSEIFRHKLNQAEILIENWHTLMPLKQAERSVVKKGAESHKSFVRRVLGKLSNNKDIVVINDEAHHAYRIPAEFTIKKQDDFDPEEATRWIEGLDRINKEIRIQKCFDLSATPFTPSGKTNTEQGLFDWIISDFGLNDAIESGLVKTPRVVVRDGVIPDTATLKPKLYHLYRDDAVKDDFSRRGAEAHEPLPMLVQQAYTLLGADWREAAKSWEGSGHVSPPVMLTVCNKTETASRIEYFFNNGDCHWPELKASLKTLRVDSKVLEKAEIGEAASTDRDYEEKLKQIVQASDMSEDKKKSLSLAKKEQILRQIVDTVGKPGQAGSKLQNVISVAMLSEGWDAKNVTHIMGLRAFTSQLLCEQVIGRGLRRVGYDTEIRMGPDGRERELFAAEYVNVFGVPLSIFQDDSDPGSAPPPPKPSTQILALIDRNFFEIKWPNVLRVDGIIRSKLTVNFSEISVLKLDPSKIPLAVELAPAIGGVTNWEMINEINLEELPEEFRLQRLIFKSAQKAFIELNRNYKGSNEYLAFQLIKIIEKFIDTNKLEIPSAFHQNQLKKRILIALSIDLIVQHLMRYIVEQNEESTELIYDQENPIGSTASMRTWYTTKPCQRTVKSQISHVVVDSAWEAHVANVLESSDLKDIVNAYAKNDHLGFAILYMWNGSKRKYIPDYLIKLSNGKTLLLEVKGQINDQEEAKWASTRRLVEGINNNKIFGVWVFDIVTDMAKVQDIILKHSQSHD
jgi:type III restriction enzyme